MLPWTALDALQPGPLVRSAPSWAWTPRWAVSWALASWAILGSSCVRFGFDRPTEQEVGAGLRADTAIVSDATRTDGVAGVDAGARGDGSDAASSRRADGAHVVDGPPTSFDTSSVRVDARAVRADLGKIAGACISSATQIPLSATMVSCDTGAKGLTQCAAGSMCGAQWHLCTATEFLARGGRTRATNPRAWLATCVRRNNQVFAPTDTVCGDPCGSSSATALIVAWSCGSSAAYTSTARYVGAVASTVCTQMGVQGSRTAAFWEPSSTAAQTQRAALCCR